MPNERELDGLDPIELMEVETDRIDRHYRSLPGDRWAAPSRCEGWTARDVLAHLRASEDYNRATLEGRAQDFLREVGSKGATDLHSFNAMGIAELSDRADDELLVEWRNATDEVRRGLRERGDGDIDTSIGAYPARWQAFHLAQELATHADDVGAPVDEAERAARDRWRARVARFVLSEGDPAPDVEVDGERTTLRRDGVEVTVDDHQLIEGSAARLDASSGLTPDQLALLSVLP